ncbi:Vacuolar protein sorting-associated protein ist1 [Microsporum canis]
MPLPKQTQDLIFALQALVFRLRQLKKERQGYSKAKHRELARLLKEGREDFARIKTEDVISNDNLIAALEVLELHCEQLQVRANILDHLAFGQKKNKTPARHKGRTAREVRSKGSPGGGKTGEGTKPATGSGWGIWNLFGFSSTSSSSPAAAPQQAVDRPSSQQLDQHLDGSDAQTERKDEENTEKQYDVYLDPELDRSAAVVFYSYARIPRDVPGLLEVKNKLALRWGSDFASRAQDDDDLPVELPEILLDRLRVRKAPESLVESYLNEIARSHGIPYGDVDINEQQETEQEETSTNARPVEDKQVEGPSGDSNARPEANTSTAAKEIASKLGGIPEVDELARRFAALKK